MKYTWENGQLGKVKIWLKGCKKNNYNTNNNFNLFIFPFSLNLHLSEQGTSQGDRKSNQLTKCLDCSRWKYLPQAIINFGDTLHSHIHNVVVVTVTKDNHRYHHQHHNHHQKTTAAARETASMEETQKVKILSFNDKKLKQKEATVDC